jgi:hypothetical protein
MAHQAMACQVGGEPAICPGEVVYKGTDYSQGATVVAINRYKNTATVRSNYNGNMGEELIADLYLTTGCTGRFCVNDLVYKGTDYSQGATIIAIHPSTGQVVARSNYNANLGVESVSDLYLTRGCIGKLCVDGLVYKGTDYSQGATIVAIQPNVNQVIVRSNYNGNLGIELASSLSVTRGCVYGVCVGDTIFKGSDYSQGAEVIAVNRSERTVLVRSVYNGNIGIEDPRDLSVTNACADYDEAVRESSMN